MQHNVREGFSQELPSSEFFISMERGTAEGTTIRNRKSKNPEAVTGSSRGTEIAASRDE